MHCYRVAGLAVASEIELLGAIPAQHTSAPAVTVRAAAVPASLPDATKKGEAPRWTSGDFFRRGKTDGWRDDSPPNRPRASSARMMRRLGYDMSSTPVLALTG